MSPSPRRPPRAEALDKYCCPGERRYLKRLAARADRRAGKALLDEAPRRRTYSGWRS